MHKMTMDNFRESDMPAGFASRAAEFKGDDGMGTDSPPAIDQVEERPYPLPEIAATSTPGNVDEDGQQIYEDGTGRGDAMAQTQSSDKIISEGEQEHLDTHSDLADEVAESGDRLGYNEHDVLTSGVVVDTVTAETHDIKSDFPHQAEPAANEDTDEDNEDKVPTGSSADVLAWVDNDKERAQKALDKESESGSPRKGLTAELKEILAA
jgi:hypothetical protein